MIIIFDDYELIFGIKRQTIYTKKKPSVIILSEYHYFADNCNDIITNKLSLHWYNYYSILFVIG